MQSGGEGTVALTHLSASASLLHLAQSTAVPRMSTSGGAPSGNIRVYVRVRPLNARERESGGTGGSGGCLRVLGGGRVELQSRPEPRLFTFDHAADTQCTQQDVFDKVGKPITESCMQGYNGTVRLQTEQRATGREPAAETSLHCQLPHSPCRSRLSSSFPTDLRIRTDWQRVSEAGKDDWSDERLLQCQPAAHIPLNWLALSPSVQQNLHSPGHE